MKIIAHRGARGIELENSLASLGAALQYDVDGIEFDIHRTRDDELVVMHDSTTARTAGGNLRIRDVTLDELRQIRLKDGQQIPTLDEALALMSGRHVFIDIKSEGCADLVVKLLQRHSDVTASFESFLPSELARIRELLPDAPTYPYFLKTQNLIARPFKMVRVAQEIHATGVSIDKWYLLNPLSYYLPQRHGLEMLTYSVGSLWSARLLLRFYPTLNIITGRPEAVNKHTLPK